MYVDKKTTNLVKVYCNKNFDIYVQKLLRNCY